MPQYRPTSRTAELSLPSDPSCTFTIKSPTYGDYSEAVKATYRVVPDRAAAPVDWYAQFVEEAALLLVSGWNLTDESGETLPITAETLHQLDRKDGDFLVSTAGTWMEGRASEEEAPFENGSGPSSKASRKSSRPRS